MQPANGAAAPALTPNEAKQRADQSHLILRSMGAIMTVLMRSQGHRHLTLADLSGIVVPAVASGQFTVAEASSKQTGIVTPVAFVIWGSFSAAIDAKLSAEPELAFPTQQAEWTSGDVVWIVDAAGDSSVISTMLKQQQETSWKGKTVRMRVAGEGGRIAVSTLMQKPAG